MYHEINASRFFPKESDNFEEVEQCPREVHIFKLDFCGLSIPQPNAAVSRSHLNRMFGVIGVSRVANLAVFQCLFLNLACESPCGCGRGTGS